MTYSLGQTGFMALVPGSIRDDAQMRGAVRALDTLLAATGQTIPNLLLFSRLARDTGQSQDEDFLPPFVRLINEADGLPALSEALLDLLAWQLHVENYEAAVDIQAKGELICGSLLLHRRRGTPWAVRHGLETALRLPAELRQWFEYQGNPYFFRVRLDVSGHNFDENMAFNAIHLIFEQKNVRSWLDCLETVSTTQLPVALALAGVSRTLTRSRLYFPEPEPVSLPMRVGIGLYNCTSGRIVLYFPVPKPVRLAPRIAIAAQIITRSRICPTQP